MYLQQAIISIGWQNMSLHPWKALLPSYYFCHRFIKFIFHLHLNIILQHVYLCYNLFKTIFYKVKQGFFIIILSIQSATFSQKIPEWIERQIYFTYDI